MAGMIENIIRRSSFADASAVHDNDLIAHGGNDAKIMSDQNDRHTQLLLKILHQLQNLSLNGYVQSRRRLICDQNVRLAGKCHGDHNTLTHTAGELKRILLDPAFRLIDAYHLEQLNRTAVCCGSGLVLRVKTKCLTKLPSNRKGRIQRSHGILENDGTLFSAEFVHLLLVVIQDILAVEEDLSLYNLSGRSKNLHDGIGSNGFSGA